MVLWPIRARVLFELFYNLIFHLKGGVLLDGGSILDRRLLLKGGSLLKGQHLWDEEYLFEGGAYYETILLFWFSCS